jgi:hypothetical protein
MEGLVAQDTGIIDHHIHPAERVEGVLHKLVAVGDGVMVGFGNTAGGTDFSHHPIRCRGVGALPLR